MVLTLFCHAAYWHYPHPLLPLFSAPRSRSPGRTLESGAITSSAASWRAFPLQSAARTENQGRIYICSGGGVWAAIFRPKRGYTHTYTFMYLTLRSKASALNVTVKVGMKGKIEFFSKVHFSKRIWGDWSPGLSQSASGPPVNGQKSGT